MFELSLTAYNSSWHDIWLWPEGQPSTSSIIKFITEILMYVTAKMEVYKSTPSIPIKQDVNKDDTRRYYTHGTLLFIYGMIPQTLEDPLVLMKPISDGRLYSKRWRES